MSTVSTGRGGAGNMGSSKSKSPPPSAANLATPTIKSSTFTTGRGGSGNMATNDPKHPERARAAQDVEAPVHVEQKEGNVHHGRGGAANVVKKGEEGEKKRRPSFREMAKEGLERIRSTSAGRPGVERKATGDRKATDEKK